MKRLELAIDAAIKAGAEILKIYNDPNSDFEIERKSDNSPLTIADKAAHRIIIETLAPTGIYTLSEEGKLDSVEERLSHSTLWIIDPLDGTKEFIKRNGEFTVNIALVERGVPVLGVIYLPVKSVLYFGSREIGASYTLEGVTEQNPKENIGQYLISATPLPLKEREKRCFTIVASRSHLNVETEEFIERMKRKHGEVECVSSGSSIKIALVAEGSADIYPRFAPTMEWDTAAGDAIARYAGAKVVRCEDNKALKYNKANLLNPWFLVSRKTDRE